LEEKMNKFGLLLFLLFASMAHWVNAPEAIAADPRGTVERYLLASEKGDVEAMKEHISGPYFERRKDLIENNKGYGDFLKDHLDGTMIEIIEVVTQADMETAIVVLKNYLKDGYIVHSKMVLKRNEGGKWSIFDEIYE
jgi:hypothetical protein